MTCVVARFRLLSGHYQATPWYHHVNEGLVEWPPSPFRLVRALLATGYTKLGWPDGAPPEQAAALIEKLCNVLPRYALPATTRTHTRHYMPLGSLDKNTGEPVTTKVFDAFSVVERSEGENAIWVAWDVELDPAQRSLLSELIRNMSYLGRAESWVEGELVESTEAWPKTFNAVPFETGASESGEVLDVLAPQTPQGYLAWRNAAFEGALIALDTTGKKPNVKQKEALLERFPATLTLALCTSTGALQKLGFSRAPASRSVTYAYNKPAVTVTRTQRATHTGTSPAFMLFSLASNTERGDVLPIAARTLRVAELFHRAVVRNACGEDNVRDAPDQLTGMQNQEKRLDHDHVHYFPLCLSHKSRIDHVLAYCPTNFSAESEEALRALRFLYDAKTKVSLLVSLVSSGDQQRLLGQPKLAVLRSATHFTSLTPFVCPRFAKKSGKNTVEGQIRAELADRNFPDPTSVELWDASAARDARFFLYERRRYLKPPPSGYPLGVTLTFAKPASGPIAIGYGSHFGLGLFTAVE